MMLGQDSAHWQPDYTVARDSGVLVEGCGPGGVALVLREGASALALLEVRRVAGPIASWRRVAPPAFEALLAQVYGDGTMAAAEDLARADTLPAGFDLPSAEDLLGSTDDAPVIRLINGLLAEGLRQGASDIHLEPYEQALVVRLRRDGQLAEILRLPAHVAPMLASRIKVMARLDIAERRLPQDGRMALDLAGRLVDVRVSTLPSRAGERVVLRLLDKARAGLDLAALGLDGAAEAVLHRALAQPNGIVLVTGPTGSGKTTTLYAALGRLNDGARNILTVEDPVEYAIDGVGQTQVNPRLGLTFAAGLRAILRQDPDVVMVGEIRDAETAQIAVQAALTGHLVLATVHTNDAAGAITRLRDMGVEPFLLAATLRAVLAQRLVRRLCPHCRAPEAMPAPLAATLGLEPGSVAMAAPGCAACNETGHSGRVGVFEALWVDDGLRRLLHDDAGEDALAAHAFGLGVGDAGGAPRLADAARALVLAGTVSAAEAARILRQDQG
ncbi:GspE/PulE family protein [Novosphingobium pokkalii]|uniref:General secretion pathway protein E n=1 Tax=Novosphingobium pokkalii TaxID=1770194 RepID=A0ABV7V694_9SPHN|nr:ATPase, T2SS/T4P/T4SS family [Novosphingobium pokkalii]GHC88843.1 type II secretion system protein GspE [Novosphingobium pokkalii]